jgi:N-acetylglucosaminyl-diphospho-decaprenol L-rhamnosyltransferase
MGACFYNASVPSAQPFPGEAAIPDPKPLPELAVVVVNYDSGNHLRTCIFNLSAAAGGLNAAFIVVDNNSTDGSLEGVEDMDPAVRVIRNPQNMGYGRACNVGFRSTGAPFVCFLNPDIEPCEGSLAEMLKAISDRPTVGVLGPRLNNPDGTRYPSCRIVPTLGIAIGHATLGLFTHNNRFTRAYQLMDEEHVTEQEVEWVSGAAMMVRREAFEHIEGFDEGFFMYVEDVDLCNRMNEAGWKALYFPDAEMMHHVAGSSRRHPYKMIRHHHFSMIRFAARKTKGPVKLALPVIAVGLLVRMVLAWAHLFVQRVRGH